MKTLAIILLLGLLSCSQINSNDKHVSNRDSLSTDSEQLSNNPGNIINDGLIVSDNNRIYYVSTDSTDGLFTQKLNGTDVKRLSGDYIEYLNLLDGWLYYRKARSDKNPNGGGLYKMKTDGTQELRLTSDEPFYINVINDWVYYINWSYSTDVCKIKTDGTSSQILYSGHYQCLTTDGNYLYFGEQAGSGTSLLYKGSFDGHELKQISSDTLEPFFIYGDYIYYSKDYNKICRMNKNSLKVETLLVDANLSADYIIPDKNVLYFGGVFGIQKFSIHDRRIDTLFKTRVIQLGIASDYIYFTTAEWDSNNIRHTKTFLTKLDSLKNLLKHVE